MKNRSHRYGINRTRPMHGHKYTNYKFVSVWWWSCAISNTLETSEAEFMKKLSNTEAERIKSVPYKIKRVSRLVILNFLFIFWEEKSFLLTRKLGNWECVKT